jgi:hypothetical protein
LLTAVSGEPLSEAPDAARCGLALRVHHRGDNCGEQKLEAQRAKAPEAGHEPQSDLTRVRFEARHELVCARGRCPLPGCGNPCPDERDSVDRFRWARKLYGGQGVRPTGDAVGLVQHRAHGERERDDIHEEEHGRHH